MCTTTFCQVQYTRYLSTTRYLYCSSHSKRDGQANGSNPAPSKYFLVFKKSRILCHYYRAVSIDGAYLYNRLKENWPLTTFGWEVYIILFIFYYLLFSSENSVLAICQQDFNTTVVGFLAVRDYPLLPAIHPGAWEEYVWAKYKYVYLPIYPYYIY